MSQRAEIWCGTLRATPDPTGGPVLAAAAALERRRLGIDGGAA